MTALDILVFVHAFATAYMAGVIWFVQIVHYPLMSRVGREGFVDYEQRHMSLTTWVVAPPMWIELGTSGWLCYALWATSGQWIAVAGAVLVVVNWVSTFALQVPYHSALARGFDERKHRFLVRSNWIRTLAWSARAVLALYLLFIAQSLHASTSTTL